MFKIIHRPNGKFSVIAPDGESFNHGQYSEPLFFQWKGEQYMAITAYFSGEVSEGVKRLTHLKTEEIDNTLGK